LTGDLRPPVRERLLNLGLHSILDGLGSPLMPIYVVGIRGELILLHKLGILEGRDNDDSVSRLKPLLYADFVR
jgi:hypothetical protein